MIGGNYLYGKMFSPFHASVSSILASKKGYSKLLSISHATKLLSQPVQLQTFIHFQKNYKKYKKHLWLEKYILCEEYKGVVGIRITNIKEM